MVVSKEGTSLTGRSFLILPSCVIVAIMLSGLVIATQLAAGDLGYQDALGSPLFILGDTPIYSPKFLYWWWVYGDYAPDVFYKASIAIHVSVFLGVVVAFAFALYRARRKKESTSHGSARWATREEIEKSGLLGKKENGKWVNSGIILGLTDKGEYLRHDGPEHAITTAPTRSGKGVGNILPTLWTWRDSCVVTDIKRENWEKTAGFRKEHLNNVVLKFEPTADDGTSVKYNPLSEVRIKTKHEVQDVQNIVNMLVDPEGIGKLDNDHWTKTAAALLVGVCIHLKYKDEHASLSDVANFLANPAQTFDETLNEMLITGHEKIELFAHIYKGSVVSHPYVVKGAYNAFVKGSQEKDAIITRITQSLADASEDEDQIHVLNMIRLRTKEEVNDATKIAKQIIGSGNEFWLVSAVELLVSVILHVLYKNPKATLFDVRGVIENPDLAFDETLLKLIVAGHERIEFLAEMYKGQLSTHPEVARAARNMLNKADKERSSVLSTAVSCLGLYSDPIISENISVSEFRIADLMNHSKPVSLYLVSPPSDIQRTLPLFRMVITQIVDTLASKMEYENGQQVKSYNYRLLMLLDEFPALGKLSKFEKALAYCAGYGIKAWIIIQELNQLYNIYTDKNAIMGNCHVRLFHTANDVVTQRYISELLGDKTEIVETRNYSGNRLNIMLKNESTNTTESTRRLMTPSEVGQMPHDKEIIFVGGQRPIYANKLFYFKDMNFKKREMAAPKKSDVIRSVTRNKKPQQVVSASVSVHKEESCPVDKKVNSLVVDPPVAPVLPAIISGLPADKSNDEQYEMEIITDEKVEDIMIQTEKAISSINDDLLSLLSDIDFEEYDEEMSSKLED